VDRVALTETDIEPAVGDDVDGGEVLGQLHGMVEWKKEQVESDADALGDRGDGGRDGDDRGRVTVVGEVVLGEPHGVEAELLGFPDELEFVAVEIDEGSPTVGLAEAEHQAEAHVVGHLHARFLITVRRTRRALLPRLAGAQSDHGGVGVWR
jgi:hypothetical protein